MTGAHPMTPFDLWWDEYPRKVSKIPARVAYAKAAKLVGHNVLLLTVKAYRSAANGYKAEDRRFIPYPATWLNAGKWDDDQAEWVDAEQQAAQAKREAEKRRFQRIQDDSRKRMAESDADEAEMLTSEYQAKKRASFTAYHARQARALTSAPKDVP